MAQGQQRLTTGRSKEGGPTGVVATGGEAVVTTSSNTGPARRRARVAVKTPVDTGPGSDYQAFMNA